jgi:pimeloyl-ACP methyl ester carboxylesterase
LRYDQRGFGKSAPPDVPYSPAADLGAVLDHAGVDRAALVGCSIVGAVTLQFLLAHPGRVTGLILVAASTSGLPFEPVPEYFAALGTGDLEQIHAVTIRVLASGQSGPGVEERIRAVIADNVAGQLTMGKNWLDSEPAYRGSAAYRCPRWSWPGPSGLRPHRRAAGRADSRRTAGDPARRRPLAADADRRSLHRPARRIPGQPPLVTAR